MGDHRLALSLFLGGLPLIGGGRQFWNSTDGNPAGATSQVLLYRGMRTRMQRLAPFLQWDTAPYYAAADGHVYVIDVGYATTDQLPYSESFNGVRYLRSTVVGVMDAYSGETKLYVAKPKEPITATWMKVYPKLFTPLAQLPAGLKAHLKYGEDAFDVQAAALARYHVTSAETFFNGDQAWAFTEEATGTGTNGVRVASPSRYTYLVLPGETNERFSVIRSYKPAAQGKGLGFSGWLAIDSEPDKFGEATILQFPQSAANGEQLDSLDTFTSNVARDPVLSGEIGVRSTPCGAATPSSCRSARASCTSSRCTWTTRAIRCRRCGRSSSASATGTSSRARRSRRRCRRRSTAAAAVRGWRQGARQRHDPGARPARRHRARRVARGGGGRQRRGGRAALRAHGRGDRPGACPRQPGVAEHGDTGADRHHHGYDRDDDDRAACDHHRAVAFWSRGRVAGCGARSPIPAFVTRVTFRVRCDEVGGCDERPG